MSDDLGGGGSVGAALKILWRYSFFWISEKGKVGLFHSFLQSFVSLCLTLI